MTRDRKVPTPGLGLLAWCIYVVLFIGLFVILGVDYDDVAKSSANVIKAIIVPVGVAALAMAILTTRWGWWREVMHDTPAGPRWMLVIPALLAIGIVVGLASAPWGDWDSDTVILVLAGCLMVGFGEEITNRGLLLVGLRGRLPEARVWLISSGMFALLHAFNIFTGQAVGATIQQMIFAFLVGSVFYATRRITGLLVIPMILHAFWDFSSFVGNPPGAAREVSDGAIGQNLALFGAIVITLIVLRRLFRESPLAEG